MVNLILNKYLSNVFDLILLIYYNKISRVKIKNIDEKAIKNLGSHFFLSEKSIQYLPSIFNKHNSWLWNYIIDTQDSCRFILANYKKVYQTIQKKFEYQPKPW